MTSQRYQGLFESWEIGVAKKVIARFVKQWKCLEREGIDDLLQECLTEWHFSKSNFNPSLGANIRTFMARVLEHKLQHIIEKLTADKRKVAQECVSLDERISGGEDSPTFLDQLSDDQKPASNLHVSTELKTDISRTIHKLTPKQQELCRLLGEESLSMSEASEALKTPRGTLYEEVKRIKAIFEKASLHDYLD